MVKGKAVQQPQWLRYLISLLLLVPTTLFLWLLRDSLTLANFSLIYILLILIIAVWIGLGPALLAAIASFFGFNFFLIRPYYTLTVEDPRELLDLFIFLLVAVIASQVASYARRQAAMARQRTAEQQILYDLTSAFNQYTEAEDVARELKRVVAKVLGAEEVTLLPDINQHDSTEPTSERSTTSFILLSIGDDVYGTLAAQFPEPPTEAQSRLLMACTVQAAMALQRIELAGSAQRSRLLEEADQLKTAILHAVSHDLRTPITIIKTSADNLQQLHDVLSPDAQLEMVQVIEEEADHLNRLVGDLLDMSRLQAGELALRPQWNSLEEIASDVAARAYRLNETERVRLEFPDNMPLVWCDYGLLLRALSNITENALQYEPGESQVVIRARVNHDFGMIANQDGDPEAWVIVENHGPTIPDREKQVIMEPFYRRRDAGGGREGHSGLGLAIARGIVQAHQGRIWVEDTRGGGATFIVALPLEQKEQDRDVNSSRR